MSANEKYRIAYTVPRSRIAGSENALLKLVRGMDRQRFDSTLICPDAGPLVDILRNEGFRTVVISRKQGRMRTFLQLYSVLKENRIQLLHVCSSKLDAICGRIAGARVVERQNNSAPRFLNKIKILQRLYSVLVLDHVITVAHAMKTRLVAQGFQERKITAVYNGIVPARAGTDKNAEKSRLLRELSVSGDKILIALVGRLDEQKGHRVFLDAIKLLENEDADLLFLIVGDGPLEETLKQQNKRLGLEEKVMFLGHRSDIEAIYTISDIVVIPSLWEPLANVALEAMVAGKPVIASDVDGMKEAVVHAETGLLVPPNEPAKLAAAILELAHNEQKRTCFGAAGKDKIVRDFTLEKMVRQTEAIFLDFLSDTDASEAAASSWA